MSVTWTQQVSLEVEQWLGKPVKVVEASRCSICDKPSTRLREASGWSWPLGETIEVAVCPSCAGGDDD